MSASRRGRMGVSPPAYEEPDMQLSAATSDRDWHSADLDSPGGRDGDGVSRVVDESMGIDSVPSVTVSKPSRVALASQLEDSGCSARECVVHHELAITQVTDDRLVSLTAALEGLVSSGEHLSRAMLGRRLNRDVALRQQAPDPRLWGVEPTAPPLASNAAALWRDVLHHAPWRLAPPGAPRVTTRLRVDGWLALHRSWCHCDSSECQAATALRDAISFGLDPHLPGSPLFSDFEDNRSCKEADPALLARDFEKELDRQAVEPVPATGVDLHPANPRSFVRKRVFNPLDGTYGSKDRLCLDASREGGANSVSTHRPIRYANVEHVLRLVTPDCWFQSRDLVKGFQQVPLRECFRRWLAFRADCGGSLQRFRYRTMPFGWSEAPLVFSILTAEIVAAMGERGFACSAYIDDIIVIGSTKDECDAAGMALDELLASVGFQWHLEDKGDLVSVQRIVYLGVEIDSTTMTLHLPDEKVASLSAEIEAALTGARVERRALEAIVGRLQWASACIRGSRGHLRSLYEEQAEARRRGHKWVHRHLLQTSLRWWLGALSQATDGVRIWAVDEVTQLAVFKSDASGDSHADAGFGAVFGRTALVGRWEVEDISEWSTTALELVPILLALRQWGDEWRDRLVVAGVDNSGAFFGVNTGRSKEPRCNALLLEIFDLCHFYNIDLVASWVPRDWNTEADGLSKLPLPTLRQQFDEVVVVADPLAAMVV